MLLINEYLIDHPQFKEHGAILVDIPLYKEKSPRGLENVFVSEKKVSIKSQLFCEIPSTDLLYLIKTKSKRKTTTPNNYLKKMSGDKCKIFRGNSQKAPLREPFQPSSQIVASMDHFTQLKNKVTKPLMLNLILILQRKI